MGKNVSFEIAKDMLVEGPTHHIEHIEENEVHPDPNTENCSLAGLKSRIDSRRKRQRFHNTSSKRQSRSNQHTQGYGAKSKQVDREHLYPTWGDDHPSPKSYTQGEASHKTPDDGSQHTV